MFITLLYVTFARSRIENNPNLISETPFSSEIDYIVELTK